MTAEKLERKRVKKGSKRRLNGEKKSLSPQFSSLSLPAVIMCTGRRYGEEEVMLMMKTMIVMIML